MSTKTESVKWKLGDSARIASYDNCRWCEIIEIDGDSESVTVMMEDGGIQYTHPQELETRESYIRSCERMRDEWTGTHYRKMVEMVDKPFVKHPKWGEWMARAMGLDDPVPKLSNAR